MDSRGCAQGPNGELLDTSEIEWFHDPDSTTPLSLLSGDDSGPPSGSTNSIKTIDQFFGHEPAQNVGGARRSTRKVCPSARTTDPDNAMAMAGSRRKCDTSVDPSRHHCTRKIVPDSDEVNADNGDTEDEHGTEDIQEDSGYQYTKSLGDADREVSAPTWILP
jgi:hypothetical protein